MSRFRKALPRETLEIHPHSGDALSIIAGIDATQPTEGMRHISGDSDTRTPAMRVADLITHITGTPLAVGDSHSVTQMMRESPPDAVLLARVSLQRQQSGLAHPGQKSGTPESEQFSAWRERIKSGGEQG